MESGSSIKRTVQSDAETAPVEVPTSACIAIPTEPAKLTTTISITAQKPELTVAAPAISAALSVPIETAKPSITPSVTAEKPDINVPAPTLNALVVVPEVVATVGRKEAKRSVEITSSPAWTPLGADIFTPITPTNTINLFADTPIPFSNVAAGSEFDSVFESLSSTSQNLTSTAPIPFTTPRSGSEFELFYDSLAKSPLDLSEESTLSIDPKSTRQFTSSTSPVNGHTLNRTTRTLTRSQSFQLDESTLDASSRTSRFNRPRTSKKRSASTDVDAGSPAPTVADLQSLAVSAELHEIDRRLRLMEVVVERDLGIVKEVDERLDQNGLHLAKRMGGLALQTSEPVAVHDYVESTDSIDKNFKPTLLPMRDNLSIEGIRESGAGVEERLEVVEVLNGTVDMAGVGGDEKMVQNDMDTNSLLRRRMASNVSSRSDFGNTADSLMRASKLDKIQPVSSSDQGVSSESGVSVYNGFSKSSVSLMRTKNETIPTFSSTTQVDRCASSQSTESDVTLGSDFGKSSVSLIHPPRSRTEASQTLTATSKFEPPTSDNSTARDKVHTIKDTEVIEAVSVASGRPDIMADTELCKEVRREAGDAIVEMKTRGINIDDDIAVIVPPLIHPTITPNQIPIPRPSSPKLLSSFAPSSQTPPVGPHGAALPRGILRSPLLKTQKAAKQVDLNIDAPLVQLMYLIRHANEDDKTLNCQLESALIALAGNADTGEWGQVIDRAVTEMGWNPLHCAVRNDQPTIVEYLLAKGADPNVVDWQGRTPLHFAARLDETTILKALLDAGANVNTRDHYGSTPLHWATKAGYLDVVSLLGRCQGRSGDEIDEADSNADIIYTPDGPIDLLATDSDGRDVADVCGRNAGTISQLISGM